MPKILPRLKKKQPKTVAIKLAKFVQAGETILTTGGHEVEILHAARERPSPKEPKAMCFVYDTADGTRLRTYMPLRNPVQVVS